MKTIFLKVKIKTLMLEAKVIRIEESRAYINRHARKRARRNNEKVRAPGDRDLYLALREHRTGVVRQEARASQLAYGFLRGNAYRTIEGPTTRNPVDKAKVARMVGRFNNKINAEVLVNEWLDVA